MVAVGSRGGSFLNPGDRANPGLTQARLANQLK